MSSSPTQVRALSDPAELESYLTIAIPAFRSHLAPSQLGPFRQMLLDLPQYYPAQIRGALQDGDVIGGYAISERRLLIGWRDAGGVRLRAGCIGNVCTQPERRMQGVGRTLMEDAVAYACAQGLHVLLLTGIPDFYHRFGFADVFDAAKHAIERKLVSELPRSAYPVREATSYDAPALLELYERHYGLRPGGYARDLRLQERRMNARPPLVALDPLGRLAGYMFFSTRFPDQQQPIEVAAEDWEAALALLQVNAELLARAGDPTSEIIWPLPYDSSTYWLLADRLPLRSETKSYPDSGWMARVAHWESLLEALGPLLRVRGGRRLPTNAPSGSSGVASAQEALRELARDASGPGSLAQLLLGYRPCRWIAQQSGGVLCEEQVTTLEAYLPQEPVWFAGTDGF